MQSVRRSTHEFMNQVKMSIGKRQRTRTHTTQGRFNIIDGQSIYLFIYFFLDWNWAAYVSHQNAVSKVSLYSINKL